jgi:predicted TIM-barrel enzyme
VAFEAAYLGSNPSLAANSFKIYKMIKVPAPDKNKKPQIVAMVHVPANNILQNTVYLDRFEIKTYSVKDLEILNKIRIELNELFNDVLNEIKLPFLEQCRSSVFIFRKKQTDKIEQLAQKLPFVQYLLQRALREVDIFVRNGIGIIEVENIAAPYFIGDKVPVEDLLILNIICKAIREKYPNLIIGLHLLSSNEIESLSIAIISGAYFIRSETSVFSGFRPEGKTLNRSNLAKFYYLRNYLQAYLGVEDQKDRRYPKIWSDLQKKHTVFEQELADLDVWLKNILFMKLEGIILTGSETGKDVSEKDLVMAREAIENLKKQTEQYFDDSIEVPLITGSGLDMDLYRKYADFIITGTQLKKNKYWENEVDEENVKALIEKMKG